MSALAARLREMIAADGPLPIDRFMSIALGDPVHGYYMTRDPFGAAGDFTTAPEISQIFGELIGLWACDLWMRLNRPDPFLLVELGPGRGTMMADALRAARVVPDFLASLRVVLVETSPILRRRQQAALASAPAPVAWLEHLADAPAGPLVLLANEFFDALPIRQFVMTDEGWRERLVGLDEQGELAFGLSAAPQRNIDARAPVGAVREIGAAAAGLMREAAERVVRHAGAALVIDYGSALPAPRDTLQALGGGRAVHPLADPGESDLTSHVDFCALGQSARSAGARVFGPVRQGDFLRRLGLEARRDRLARDSGRAEQVRAAADRLVDCASASSMGTLFKAMAITAPDGPEPAGFGEA
jgi:SAM-dependent MidA family methyltransferase